MKSLSAILITLTFLGSIWVLPNVGGAIESKAFSDLVKTDHLESVFNLSLMKLGISGESQKVIVGRSDFLFLGEKTNHSARGYLNARSFNVKLQSQNLKSLYEATKSIGLPMLLYVPPSKASVYPEMLPDSFGIEKPFSHIAELEAAHPYLISNRQQLIDAKRSSPMYRKWDSHWNAEAAYLSYLTLLGELNQNVQIHSEIVKGVNFISKTENLTGDLSNLLKLNFFSEDLMALITKPETLPLAKPDSFKRSTVTIQNIDDDSFQLVGTGNSVQNRNIDINSQSKLVINVKARNPIAILWIRDSFGDQMSQYMHETFAKSYQVHPNRLNTLKNIEDLLSLSQPDLLILTITERHYVEYVKRLEAAFSEYAVSPNTKQYKQCADNERFEQYFKRLDGVTRLKPASYESISDDPNIWAPVVGNRECESVSIKGQIKVQRNDVTRIYYRQRGEPYTLEKSIGIKVTPGDNFIDITLPSQFDELRIDPINAKGTFSFENLTIKGLVTD